MKERLANYFKAGYPAIAITTSEEKRALVEIEAAAKAADMRVVCWNSVDGATVEGRKMDMYQIEEVCSIDLAENTVLVLEDVHLYPLDQNPPLNRIVKDLVLRCSIQPSTVVFLGESFTPPATFSNFVTMMEFSLPSHSDIEVLLDRVVQTINDASENSSYEPDNRQEIIRAASGMSSVEIENALLLSYIESKKIDPPIVYREKVAAIKRSGLLQLISPDPLGVEGIGGLEYVKEYVGQRRLAFSDAAKEYGLPVPRGVLMCGIPGTGKSLAAKAMGSILGIPTLRLDMGSLFGSLVGDSERRTREALALAEAVSPVVLFVDEINSVS